MGQANDTVKLVGALLLGTAIGGALGIIFAPDKGSETRKKLYAKSEDLTDAMKEKFNELFEEAKKEIVTAKDKTNVLIENGVAKAEKFKID